MIAYRGGESTINAYCSGFAGTNKATAITWEIDALDDAIRDLVAAQGDFRTAWFKDPDGDILNVVAT